MNGKISIGRTSGGTDEAHPIRICITDEMSRVEFITIKMGLAEFASALTGQSYVECDFELRRADLVGCTAEYKQELVRGVGYSKRDDREGIAKTAYKPFEKDGWRGDVDDLFNGHRRNGEFQTVTFRRHVRPDGTPVEKP